MADPEGGVSSDPPSIWKLNGLNIDQNGQNMVI